ncbi:Flp family type IVb pilin [Vibrio sp. NTOU-M3]|uniref:Flp family type IVb pilin n=1 Tax=Vibrio sp. NTOU-M3 TaxID=3234954 RepID=UPI00349F2FD6
MYYKTLAKLTELKMKFEDDIRGVTAVEYAIIAVVMSGIVLTVFNSPTLKDALVKAMEAVTNALTKVTPPKQ